MSGTTTIPRRSRIGSASGSVGPFAASTTTLAPRRGGDAGGDGSVEGGGTASSHSVSQSVLGVEVGRPSPKPSTVSAAGRRDRRGECVGGRRVVHTAVGVGDGHDAHPATRGGSRGGPPTFAVALPPRTLLPSWSSRAPGRSPDADQHSLRGRPDVAAAAADSQRLSRHDSGSPLRPGNIEIVSTPRPSRGRQC